MSDQPTMGERVTATDMHIEELKRAGLFDKESGVYDGMIGEAVKELLETFQKQGHSGMSAAIVSRIFYDLIRGKPLSPITADPSEWSLVQEESEGLKMYQNKRCPNLFWNGGEDRPYTLDGKAFSDDGGETYVTNSDSKVYFDVPGYPPETEYVIREGAE